MEFRALSFCCGRFGWPTGCSGVGAGIGCEGASSGSAGLVAIVCVCVAGAAMREEWAGLLLQFWW